MSGIELGAPPSSVFSKEILNVHKKKIIRKVWDIFKNWPTEIDKEISEAINKFEQFDYVDEEYDVSF